MPKEVHDALEKEAEKKGLKGEEKDRYVYGGLANFEKRQKEKKKGSSIAFPGK